MQVRVNRVVRGFILDDMNAFDIPIEAPQWRRGPGVYEVVIRYDEALS
jgi:hypothetical protein